MKTAIIIPCYNEEKRLKIKEFENFLSSNQNITLVFVDDGSSDNTYSVLENIQKKHTANVKLIKQPENTGKAEAVRTGISKILEENFVYVGFFDADLATPLEALDEFIKVLETNPKLQIAMGSRVKLLGRNIERKKTRHYTGRVFATVVSQVLDLSVYDTQCGAKLFRNSEEIKKVFSTPFLSKWIFDVEIIARLKKLIGKENIESTIYELPLKQWKDISGSKLKSSDYLHAAADLWRIYFST